MSHCNKYKYTGIVGAASTRFTRFAQSNNANNKVGMDAHMRLLTVALALLVAYSTDAGSVDLNSPQHLQLKEQYLNLFKPNPGTGYQSNDFQIDTTEIANLVPHDALFNTMIPKHRQAMQKIVRLLKSQPTIEQALELAAYLRKSPNVNPKAWYYALTSWSLSDPRLQSVPKPSPVSVMPDRFINSKAMEKVEEIRQLRKNGIQADECVVVDGSAGADNGRENDLWYFREDFMNNAFHMFYHLYYYGHIDTKPDKRSETFYFIHRDVIARYDADRISNRLPRTKSLAWGPETLIQEQYYAHLNESLTGEPWGGRDANVPLTDIDWAGLNAKLADLIIVERRIYEAIANGILLPDGTRVDLDNVDGTDLLGDIIEGNEFSLNHDHYEIGMELHGSIHVAIGIAERPADEPREPAGVMLDIAVSFRDPTFYRWHLYLNDVFDANKRRLRPYTPTGGELPLVWNGVTVTEVGVQQQADGPTTNQLFTFFGEQEFALSRGLDNRGDFYEEPVQVCAKHIDHEDFVYKIVVNSENFFTRPATVRLFLVPRGDENDARFSMREQRDLIFTLDVFQTTLEPGQNVIYRESNVSSVTAHWAQTLDELDNGNFTTAACGCGFPHHMQLPKGRPEGMTFDLVAMVTNFVDDAVDYEEPHCRAAYVYCGLPDTKYPDAKPMGYPFDRLPFNVDASGNPVESGGTAVRDLDEYIRHVPNMATSQITISHLGDRIGQKARARLH